MPLVAAKCTKCGGELQIDNAQEAAICPYCGTPFIVEKAINYYTTHNVTNIGSVEHADIHMEDSRGLETRLKNAESYLVQHKDYAKAEELFRSITEEFAGDWRGWWGIVRAMTHEFEGIPAGMWQDFKYEETTEAFKAAVTGAFATDEIQKMAERAFHVVDKENEAKIRPVWSDFQRRSQAYITRYVNKAAQDYTAKKQMEASFLAQIGAKERESSQLHSESSTWQKRSWDLKRKFNPTYLFGGLIGGVTAIALSGPTGGNGLVLVGLALLALGGFHFYKWAAGNSSMAKSKRLDEQATQASRQKEALWSQKRAQMGKANGSYPVHIEPFHTV